MASHQIDPQFSSLQHDNNSFMHNFIHQVPAPPQADMVPATGSMPARKMVSVDVGEFIRTRDGVCIHQTRRRRVHNRGYANVA